MKWFPVILVVFGLSVAFIVHVERLADSHSQAQIHSDPAPGYCLVTNQLGEWAGQREGTGHVLFSVQKKMTRQAAIKRTWDQYEYEQAEDAKKWSRAE